eukprot:g2372.t1
MPQKGVAPAHLQKKRRGKKTNLGRVRKGTSKDKKRAAARAEKAEQTEQQAVEEQKPKRRVKAKSTKYVTSDQTGLVSDTQKRAFISVYYMTELDAPPKSEWKARGGTISTIIKNVSFLKDHHNDRLRVQRVLEDTCWCHENGYEYRGEGRYAQVGGHNKLILPGSFEEQLIADCMEDGLGLDSTTEYLNDYLESKGKQHTRVKYPGETRLCLGVAKVKLTNGTFEGKRARAFDYSNKTILTIDDWDAAKQAEIRRVANMTGSDGAGFWVDGSRAFKKNSRGQKTQKPVDLFGDDRLRCVEGLSRVWPPGNSPELMPLDNNLNKDLHDAVDDHVRKCSTKFSRSTWQRQTEAYLRVWEVAPPSKRIIEDVDKVFAALPIIYQAKGVTIQGLGERNGKRKAAEASGVKAKRGGARQKGERKKAKVMHADASGAIAARIAESERNYSAKLHSQ